MPTNLVSLRDESVSEESPSQIVTDCLENNRNYHDRNSFNSIMRSKKPGDICNFHISIRSLRKNIDKLSNMLSTMQKPPYIVAVSETKINKKDGLSFSNTITGYKFLHSDSEKKSDGVGIYIDSSISYQIQTDIPNALNDSASLWIEINLHKKPGMIGVIYRHPGYDVSTFTENVREILHNLSDIKVTIYHMWGHQHELDATHCNTSSKKLC